jgi:glycosyltransferase involved in cell wall biosynthesis
VLLYQGALNKDRGIEYLIESMTVLKDHFVLYIAGSGDIVTNLHALVSRYNVADHVRFFGRLDPDVLREVTSQAYIGFSVERNTCSNYYYALPNKLFDYIQARIPVIVSNLPEMRKIVEKYNVGLVLDTSSTSAIIDAVMSLYNNPTKYYSLKNNCNIAAKDLCWEKEQSKLVDIFDLVLKKDRYGSERTC